MLFMKVEEEVVAVMVVVEAVGVEVVSVDVMVFVREVAKVAEEGEEIDTNLMNHPRPIGMLKTKITLLKNGKP